MVHRQVAFLAGIAFLVFGFISLEVFCVRQVTNGSQLLLRQNLMQGLKALQPHITAMFARLNDAVFNPRITEQTSGRPRLRPLNGFERPSAIQAFADAGVVVQPGRSTLGESSAIFEAGSSRLEFQRLIALLAEQENSNAFLYLDRLLLSRPAAIPPFSELPTYIDARFSIRILATR